VRTILIVSVVLLSACSTNQINAEEKAFQDKAAQMPVANSITVTELSQYKEVGTISCVQDTISYVGGGADEKCRNTLKTDAVKLGADLVVVEARDTAKCSSGEHLCVYMHGRAYKKNVEPK